MLNGTTLNDSKAPPPTMGDEPSYEKLQGDKVRAEHSIRTMIACLAPGGAIRNLDEIVTRALGRMTPSDLQSGQIGTSALSEIVGAVETAKGNTAFNWSAATPEQIKTYMLGIRGLDLSRCNFGPGANLQSSDALSGGDGAKTSSPAGRSDYLALNLSSPQSLFGITRNGFGSTPFAAAQCGLNFDTFSSLRQYLVTGDQILGGVRDAKSILGSSLNVNGENGASLVRDAAILRKEAPQHAAKIVSTLQNDAKMIEDDQDVQSAANDATKVMKANGSETDLNDAARKLNRATDAVESRSGIKAAIDDPTLPPAARAAAEDGRIRVRREQLKHALSKSPGAKGMSPEQFDAMVRRAETLRMQDGGAAPPLPSVGAPNAAGAAQDTPSLVVPRQKAPELLRKADRFREGLSALPHQVAEAAAEANRMREGTVQGTDAIKARTEMKVASQDEFFESTGADLNSASKPQQKADKADKQKNAPPQLASAEKPKTTKSGQVADGVKKPEAADGTPVRTAISVPKNNLSQPKPA